LTHLIFTQMINKGKEQHQVRGEAKYIKQQQYKIEHRFFHMDCHIVVRFENSVFVLIYLCDCTILFL